MKCHFIFNGKRYIAPSKSEAEKFISFWDATFSKIYHLETEWRIDHIELAPMWAQFTNLDLSNVEYSK